MKKRLILSLFLASVAAFSSASDKVITHVTITTYNAVKSQTDATPTITADGTKIIPSKVKSGKQRIVAISRDLLYLFPLGSVIEVEGHGIYEVRDTMNARFNHRIDILQHTSQKNFMEEKVKITLIKKPTNKNK